MGRWCSVETNSFGTILENVSIDLPPLIGGGLYIVYGFLFYHFLRNEPLKELKPKILLE